MNMSLLNLSAEQLRRAAEIKEQMASLEHELESLLGAQGELVGTRRRGRARSFSPATIARMRAAQKARWSRIKGETVGFKKSEKRKFRRSAAVRARLSQIAKARWKKAKAAGKTTL